MNEIIILKDDNNTGGMGQDVIQMKWRQVSGEYWKKGRKCHWDTKGGESGELIED